MNTFNEVADMFIIVRSPDPLEGKKFDMKRITDNYTNIYSNKELELWIS